MAIFAGIARRQMAAGLSGCLGAVVAIHAIVDDARVVKHTDGPGNADMAGFTIICRDNVSKWFSRCMCAVMAGCARKVRHRVVKARNLPGTRFMAVLTGLG